jgi:hypothetical protein
MATELKWITQEQYLDLLSVGVSAFAYFGHDWKNKSLRHTLYGGGDLSAGIDNVARWLKAYENKPIKCVTLVETETE